MKTKCGKGYFWDYGRRDQLVYGSSRAVDVLNYRKGALWPIWAQVAYQRGFEGINP